MNGNGKQQKTEYTGKYDGRDYPVRHQKGKTVEFTRPDPYTVEGMTKTDGKTDYTFRRYVSKDGKTLTIELTTLDSAGKPSTEVLVYDKLIVITLDGAGN